jgi:hypothetical protein
MNDKMEVGGETANKRRITLVRRDLGEYYRVVEWCVYEGLGIIQCQVG